MKFLFAAALCLFVMVSHVQGQDKMVLKDQKDRISYSIGTDIANSLKRQSLDVNMDALVQGIRDTLTSSKTLLTEQEIKDTLGAFQREHLAKQMEKMKVLGEKNQKEGEKFLAENKKKENITTLPSGLQYKILQKGKGKKPKATDTVIAHYRGTSIDGKEFDSSYRRGEPATFQVGAVIPGWSEALQLMEVGSKWQVFVPSKLAYGERGAGEVIPPNSTLIFEIELVGVK